jgi:hypothetical protein
MLVMSSAAKSLDFWLSRCVEFLSLFVACCYEWMAFGTTVCDSKAWNSKACGC